MFFKFNKTRFFDLSWIGVDMHSHLLPGIDDGCPDFETSEKCINGLMELGFKRFIATPHIADGLYNNNLGSIQNSFAVLKSNWELKNAVFPDISYAAEFMVDMKMESYKKGDGLILLPQDQILIEMSYLFESPNIFDVIFNLQLQGIQPIIAHPERYVFYFKNPKGIQAFVDKGCLLQSNLLSFSGYYGKEVKAQVLAMADAGLIDYLGTDLHHTRHLDALNQLCKEIDLKKILNKCNIKNQQLAH